MATIVLSAAGAALGGAVGGNLMGLSAVAVGRFAGAVIGRSIDQRLIGRGTRVVETGRLERLRVTGSGEGRPIPVVHGRMRVAGHVIWATEFTEHVTTSGGGSGKGMGQSQPRTRSYSYSVSLAIALCEGEITGVHRVWADGVEISADDLAMRVHTGSRGQLPDPLMEAVEGAGQVPAYRGTAYVVIEELDLSAFGNRVPQFAFEVTRPAEADGPAAAHEVARSVPGVALIPGTGEYALAPEPVTVDHGDGAARIVNVNTPNARTDFEVSLDQMEAELPACETVSLVVSWFGDDLRAGQCKLRPLVEDAGLDGSMPWRAGGISRSEALEVPREAGRPVYGGTPSDASVIEAIGRLKEAGKAVCFYPFILMTQLPGNGLTDPWTGAPEQPRLPWRGRITTSLAPGLAGSPDGTATAEAEVAAFFGTASAADFSVADGKVTYAGPDEWSFRRFVLHNAALCVAAGGVESFCIGSEMRGLTRIRGAAGSFPAVTQLVALAAEVRNLLGPDVKLGYAADWSEYFGYHPEDGSGDVFFHLDPLWADPQIDFVGIDNYMPLSDWRDGQTHADAGWGSIYNLDYLRSNIEGGEGFDWFYPSPQARAVQLRVPISDDAHGEPWVFRYKDIRSWWANPHHERIGGVRQPTPTAWEPRMKPIRFTEFGCPAVDKATNEPNRFHDPKSSESALPHFSNGRRDELIQAQYLRAHLTHWSDPARNPVSEVYGGPMVDLSRSCVWAWDARPWPWFPARSELWADADNYRLGHWLNGRASGQRLATVVAEICARSGLGPDDVDVRSLHGFVRGHALTDVAEARRALQPLMLAYGFDALERDGKLAFRLRDGRAPVEIGAEELALSDEIGAALELSRDGELDLSGRVRVGFLEADGSHEPAGEEAVLPQDTTHAVSATDLPLVLTRGEARAIAERWLAEARVARESLRVALAPARHGVGPGDVLRVASAPEGSLWRVDRVEFGAGRLIEAVRIEPEVYRPSDLVETPAALRPFVPAVPVLPLFLDLPLISGNEAPHAPHLALTAEPWPGAVALWRAPIDADYALIDTFGAPSVIGRTEGELPAHDPGRIDRGAPLRVRLLRGALRAISDEALLAGGNLAAIGDGSSGAWEIIQFRDATLVGEDLWEIGWRLRGQAGSDGVMPAAWPAGSWFVLLDGTPRQIPLSPSALRVAHHYRVGPARRGPDDPAYRHMVLAFDGNGLRPYRPAHLRVRPAAGGALEASWIRRTRIGGDDWSVPEVPLGEEREAYLVRVMRGPALLREVEVSGPVWTYDAAAQADDGFGPGDSIHVAQLSALYGPGPFAEYRMP